MNGSWTDAFRRYLSSRLPGQWVGAAIAVQVVLLLGIIGLGEWGYRTSRVVTIPIVLVDRFTPIRGEALEFIPVPFRYAFKSNLSISPGDHVIVAPLDQSLSQWGIVPTPPIAPVPYYRVRVVSANDRYFFLEPPFQRIRLRESDQAWLLDQLRREPENQRLALRVRHRGETAIISDLQVNDRLIPVR